MATGISVQQAAVDTNGHAGLPSFGSMDQCAPMHQNPSDASVVNHNSAADSSKHNSPESTLPSHSKDHPWVPFVNLFKSNLMMNDKHKLQFLAPGTNRLNFSFDDIDSVEKTYGFCLLGYVISGRPPTSALIDLVRRWGKEVKFQTHESGWIVFKFPSAESRDLILAGGPYMVYGYHLFLKDMPRCFRFREKDLNSFPAWVQIHGLPPDCWNHFILSNIASEIGQPIHMDLLTHDRKRVKFARVLIEMNVAAPRVHEIQVELPIGQVAVNFVYEIDVKLCNNCLKLGHDSICCPALNDDTLKAGTSRDPPPVPRSRSKSVVWQRDRSRGRSRITSKHRHAPPRNEVHVSTATTKSLEESLANTLPISNNPGTVPETTVLGPPLETTGQQTIDKGKKVMESDLPQLGAASSVVDVMEDEYTVVTNKKNKKK